MLKDKINAREKTTGFLVNFCDVGVAKLAGCAGYDLVWIDMEHSPLTYEQLLAQVIAVRSTGTAAIVRAPQNDLTAAKKILETGPDGIIFPMIRSVEDAKRMISNTLYPPYGERGFGPQNAINYGFIDPMEFMRTNHETMCRFIQIEHKDAVECLDGLLEIPYIDGYIFGPNDLAGSYGIPGQVFDDRITKIITDVTQRIHDAGRYVGLATGDTSDATLKHWISTGIDMLVAGSDFDVLRTSSLENRKNLQKLLGI